MAKIVRHNILNANKDDAFIELKVRNNNFTKKFKIPWRTLSDNGSWSGSGSKSTYDAPSAEDKAMENRIKNTEIYNMVTGLGEGLKNSGALAKGNESGRKAAAALGMNKEMLCTIYSGEFIFGEFEKVDLSFNATININISPASKFEIEEFGLLEDTGKIHSIKAKNIKLSQYEKEPQSILDSLQNSIYDDMSQKNKKAWDIADKEHADAIQNKKDLEEFDRLSIDDLEMFVK